MAIRYVCFICVDSNAIRCVVPVVVLVELQLVLMDAAVTSQRVRYLYDTMMRI